LNALLVDTHALLWGLGDVSRLSPAAREALGAGGPAYVSAASLWEISIKQASGKLQAPANLIEKVADAKFDELAVTFRHAIIAGSLPPHHADPFDRMLVAQAQSEGLTLVTCDPNIVAYEVPVLW
jgi:PIN domain nuclease of toxin-antitoxin system